MRADGSCCCFVLIDENTFGNSLFQWGFQDITALSQEMSETFNDPFVNNATP